MKNDALSRLWLIWIFVVCFLAFPFISHGQNDVYVDFYAYQSGCQPFKSNFIPKLRYQDTINPPTIVKYEWDFGDGTPHSFDQKPDHTYQVQNGFKTQQFSVSLTVTVTSGLHYNATKSNWITVLAKPKPVIIANPNATTIASPVIQFNTDTLLSAAVDFNDPATTYTWYYKNSNSAIGSTFSNQRAFQYTYRDTGFYYISLKVVSNGCEGSDSITLYVGPQLLVYIPDIFKPNGVHNTIRTNYYSAKANEIFKPIVSYCNNYSLDIFNRNGELLFHTNDQENGWDGKYNNTYLSDDCYVYVINLKNSIGKSFSYTGNVILAR